MRQRLSRSGITATLSLLLTLVWNLTLAITALPPDDRESKILVSLSALGSEVSSRDWSVESDQFPIAVIHSEKSPSKTNVIAVFDAARLSQQDLPELRESLLSVLENTKSNNGEARIAWIEERGWKWIATDDIPSELPNSPEKQRDSFEAAVFMDLLREIIADQRQDEEPLEVLLFTRDFPVPEFAANEEPKSLPRQCFDSLVAVLTGRPIRLVVVDFSSASDSNGYLRHLAAVTGGMTIEASAIPGLFDGSRQDYILTLLTTFRAPDATLPLHPIQPFTIEVRNQVHGEEIRGPGSFWPLPSGVQAPTLSELMEAEQLRPRVATLRDGNDPVQALVLARRMVSLAPFDFAAHLSVLELLRSIGNPDPAELERSVNAALTLFPDSAEICYQKGLVTEEGGQVDEAIKWYEKALSSKPVQPDLSLQVARLQMKVDLWDKAVENLNAVVGTEIDSAAVRVDLARALRATGALQEAASQLETARQMNPSYLPIVLLEMRASLEEQEYPKALDQALQVIESHPKQPEANLVAGLALNRLQRYEEAETYLRVAGTTSPKSSFEVQYGLYEALAAQGDLDGAAQHLERAADLRPGEPGIWRTLAVLQERRGDHAGAGEAMKRGAQEHADDPRFQLSLAEWQERHGNAEEALAALERALETTSGEERSETAQRYLLLALQESGSAKVLDSVRDKLDPQVDQALLAGIDSYSQAAGEPRGQSGNLAQIVLPGGFDPLFNYAPFLKSRAQSEDLLDLLFGYLLETEPIEFANQKVVHSNPRREETINFLREHLRFKKWLYREMGTNQISQAITTAESDLQAANQLLEYFGIKIRRFKFSRPTYTPDPDSIPKLEVFVEERYEKRRTVLKWFGISSNLIGEGSVLEFKLEDSELPVLMGASYWNRNFLKAETESEILLKWLQNPQVMKLYRALSRLPAPARNHLVESLDADHLLEEITPGLLSVGAMLDFDQEGRIVLPGGEAATALWSQLIKASPSDQGTFLRNLFTQDDGKALYYLASLSIQEPEVMSFLTSDRTRFFDFYRLLPPPSKGNWLAGRPTRNFHDMADVLGMIRTDGKNIFFPAAWRNPSESPDSEDLLFAADEPLIRSLFEVGENGSIPAAARKYAILGALRFIQTPLLYGAPERLLDLGALYWLVAELGLDSSQIDTLLQQIDFIESQVSESDRRTVVALFQAPLVILRTLSSNNALKREDVAELVDMLLSQDSWQPAESALRVSAVLNAVTSRLAGDDNETSQLELFLKAFAGHKEPIAYIRDGQARKIDLATRDIAQMRASLEEHFVVPLDNVLGALDRIRESSNSGTDTGAEVTRLVKPLLTSEASFDYLSDRYRKAIEHTNARKLRSSLRDFVRSPTDEKNKASQALAEELAPYLAEALIALVYVRYIKEDDLVVQTDEHFFRKHSFEEKAFTLGSHGPQEMGGSWGQPILVKDKTLGSRIVGSLAGIARPLARLKAEQLQARSSTRFADSTFPVTQKLAVELIDQPRLTHGAITCAGRTLELGRRILAGSVIDEKLRLFAFPAIKRFCGQKRSWEVTQLLQRGELAPAVELILPSELFQLGKEYWMSQSAHSSRTPVESDLDWFFAKAPGCTWHFSHAAESPINELGFPLTTYVGVDLLFLGHLGTIEASATYNTPHRLAERSCELKLRMAELFWRMGLPSALFKPVCDKVLDRALPRVGQVDREDWRAVTQQLQKINEDDVEAVLSELFRE